MTVSAATSRSPHLEFQQNQAGFGSTIRNFLFGRVCKNWEHSALMTMAVTKVFFAALNLLTGSLFFSAFLLLSAVVDAIAIRKLRNFASWNKNLAKTHKENDRLTQSNFRFGRHLITMEGNLARMGDHLASAEKQISQMEAGLARQTELNEAYEEHTVLQREVTEEMVSAASQSTAVTTILDKLLARTEGEEQALIQGLKDRLTRLQDVSDQLLGTNDLLRRSAAEMTEDFKERLQRATEVAEKFGEISAESHRELAETQKRLDKTSATLENQTTALTHVRDALERTKDQIGKTSTESLAAAKKSHQAAHSVAEEVHRLQEAREQISEIVQAVIAAASQKGLPTQELRDAASALQRFPMPGAVGAPA